MSTSASALACNSELRRDQVRQKADLNGLDFVEVSDCQRVLTLYFLGKAPAQLTAENIRIDGGRRVTGIQVTGVETYREEDPETDDYVKISVDKAGDFSSYTLSLVAVDADSGKALYRERLGQQTYQPLAGFDPRYASLEFSFKVNCKAELDCKPSTDCAMPVIPAPDINYLAKDYASFRQLILDRLAVTMPDWQERHVPDLGITLVELLAYVGDHLSYYQDAVATEAYLDTARQRISVKRHARLVDYHLHEGCNARTWVALTVSSDWKNVQSEDFYVTTAIPDLLNEIVLAAARLPDLQPKPYLVFEPLVEDPDQALNFYAAHNEIRIYTWGDAQCCLAAGATSVTLYDPGTATPVNPEPPDACSIPGTAPEPQQSPLESDYQLHLEPCSILIFEEVKGPATGVNADADPQHRQAVRLLRAERSQDPLNGQLIWEVEWSKEDALQFSLCISSINQEDCALIEDVSVARGNVILVDHGESVTDELPVVPAITHIPECNDGCTPRETLQVAGKFSPVLTRPDITFSQPLTPCHHDRGAARSLQQNPRTALPDITLAQTPSTIWKPRLELLQAGPTDANFVIEVDDERRARLRFGDGNSGRKADAAITFTAHYRIGNGSEGNVSAESLSHLVFRNNLPEGISISLRNPLPATGGTDPEPVSEAKLFAPQAFRKTLQRAVTADDYAALVMRDFSQQVQRASARLRWAGSWYEVLVAIDPFGSETLAAPLRHRIKHHLDRYRRIGHDLVVVQAQYVPLQITLKVCVLPHYQRAHVRAALLDAFSSRPLNGARNGFFHPDNLSFGDGIYLSQLVATAQSVIGVENVAVIQLERAFAGPNGELESGVLPLASFEIAQLDQDPDFPENGTLTLDMRGGR